MWQMTYNWWEVILRAVIIYAALFILFRFMGKKQLGEMSPMDFILLLIISEGVSGGLVGEEYTVSGAIIVAVTLMSLNYLVDYTAFRSKKVEKIIEGEPQILIRDGHILSKTANKENLSKDEILQALRLNQVESIEEVRLGILETNGKISVIKNKEQ